MIRRFSLARRLIDYHRDRLCCQYVFFGGFTARSVSLREFAIKYGDSILGLLPRGKMDKPKKLLIMRGQYGLSRRYLSGRCAVCDPVNGMHSQFCKVLPQASLAPGTKPVGKIAGLGQEVNIVPKCAAFIEA